MADFSAAGPSEAELLHFLDSIYSESKNAMSTLKDSWNRGIQFFRGQQWPIAHKKPLFLANNIAPIVDRKVARLTEVKPIIRVRPRRKGLGNTAEILQRTIDAGWDEYNMQMVMDDLSYFMIGMGSGFGNLSWDPKADFGRGDIIPKALDPRMVYIDPAVLRAQDVTKGAYVIIETVMPLWEVWQRYPGRGQLVSADARLTALDDEQATSVFSRIRGLFGSGKSGGGNGSAIPRATVREYWFQDPTINDDGSMRYPGGRHVIRGGDDVVLVDEPNPYIDGQWPIDMVDGRPDMEHPWGRSEIEALRKLQEAINRIGHMFVENTILTGNVWVMADNDALTPTDINNLKNIGAIVLTKRFGRTIERQAPPPMPPHILDFVRMALGLMEQLSGLSDSPVQGQGRVELRSGAQLEGLQAATEDLIRALARRQESFLNRIGQRWISRIFQFYTQDRMLNFLGPGPDWIGFEFERQKLLQEIVASVNRENTPMDQDERLEMTRDAIRKAWQDFKFKVLPGSNLASVRGERAQLMRSLALDGFVSGTRVLQELGIANPEEEIDKGAKEALARSLYVQNGSVGQRNGIQQGAVPGE